MDYSLLLAFERTGKSKEDGHGSVNTTDDEIDPEKLLADSPNEIIEEKRSIQAKKTQSSGKMSEMSSRFDRGRLTPKKARGNLTRRDLEVIQE